MVAAVTEVFCDSVLFFGVLRVSTTFRRLTVSGNSRNVSRKSLRSRKWRRLSLKVEKPERDLHWRTGTAATLKDSKDCGRLKRRDSERRERVSFYDRTELQGSALQWGLEGHGWVLHCSRSGGLSWISQLRSLKRSPFGR